jgi:hypothetical protein
MVLLFDNVYDFIMWRTLLAIGFYQAIHTKQIREASNLGSVSKAIFISFNGCETLGRAGDTRSYITVE